MATQQPSSAPPKPRVPFAASMANRADSPLVDARLVNGYLEKGEDKTLHAYRRPGVVTQSTVAGGTAGRGVYNWLGNIYSVFAGNFYKNGVVVGAVNNDGTIYNFSPVLGAVPRLFFKNTTAAYNYDPVGGLVAVGVVATLVITGNSTINSQLITGLTSTAGLIANAGITGIGIPAGSFVLSVDSGTQVTINVNATATGAGVSFTFILPGYQPATVPGLAYLDGTMYVMDSKAKIWGSNINDTTTAGWDPLTFLTAQIEPDGGVCLAKQLVYVIAFKQWSTEFFYDAAQPVGSPLGTVQGNKVNQGCRAAATVCSLEGALLWISTTREGNVGVYLIDSARASAIGTPSVEKLLQAADFTSCWSFALHISGHKFYVVTIKNANLTLAFDLTTNEWYRWTDTNGNYFPFVDSTFDATQQVLLQHETNGKLYLMKANQFTDDGASIPWDLYTPNWDGGQRTKKMLSRMDFIGDQTEGCIVQVRVSDDDYRKWSNFRVVDMGKQRPNLRDCGTFRRRAWHFHNVSPTFLRIQFVELHVEIGTN